MARKYIDLQLHASGRFDPTKTIIECEAAGCKKHILVAESYSFVMVFATTGPSRHESFLCEDEQHFCCSIACAKKAAFDCIDEHLVPEHKEREARQLAGERPSTVHIGNRNVGSDKPWSLVERPA